MRYSKTCPKCQSTYKVRISSATIHGANLAQGGCDEKVAGLLITTEAMVAEVPRKQAPAPTMPGGGMDFEPVQESIRSPI